MKLIALIGLLSLSTTTFAGYLSCNNIDSVWPQDTLEFAPEGTTTYAYYFDTESHYSLACEVTKGDGYQCEGSGLEVRLYETGEAFVSNGVDSDVAFQCH